MSSLRLQRVYRLLWLIMIGALVAACGEKTPEALIVENKNAEIVAVNNPLFYFTQYLAGDLATVTFPVPSGVDPARWQPLVNDILKLQQADLIVLNGAGYSNWLNKVALPSTKLVNSSAAFQSQLIKLDKEATHSHGPKGEQSHSGYAFTTWMDMSLAKQQASAIAKAMANRWPEQESEIKERETKLLGQLTELDRRYQKQTRRLANKYIIYSHPVYQYFERRYHLAGHSLHWEPNEMPTERQWELLRNVLAKNNNALFIWEDVPDPEITNRMSAMGLKYIVIRPAAIRGKMSWLSVQDSNLKQLESCCN